MLANFHFALNLLMILFHSTQFSDQPLKSLVSLDLTTGSYDFLGQSVDLSDMYLNDGQWQPIAVTASAATGKMTALSGILSISITGYEPGALSS